MIAMGMDARTTAVGSAYRLRRRENCARVGLRVAFVLPLVLLGCRADPNMQLVERELRLQDKRIFELEEHLADCHSVVAAHRREIASLRRRAEADRPPASVDATKSEWDADSRLRPSPPSLPALPDIDEGDDPLSVPGLRSSGSSPSGVDDVTPAAPEYDAGPISPADDDPPQPQPASSSGGISFPQPTGRDDEGAAEEGTAVESEELPAPFPTGSAADIEQIGLRLMVRYHGAENIPLEVEALVAPRDVDLQQIRVAGDVSLMIVRMEEDSDMQLARWDFSADEIRRHWRRSPLGTGLQFRLPWPGSPQPGTYRLWARLAGEDGRKHLGSVDFEVEQEALARRPAPRRTHLAQSPPASPPPEDHAEEKTAGAPIRQSDLAAAPPSPEPQKSINDIAWKPSVEAARLPRLRQPDVAFTLAADPFSSTQFGNEERLVPWSPHRPLPSGRADLMAAERASEWSPYR